MAGLYPCIASITLPSSAIKFNKIQAGAVQHEQEAKEYKIFDLDSGEGGGQGSHVILHPGLVLFGEAKWKEPLVCYFWKTITTKPFLRDATEVHTDVSTTQAEMLKHGVGRSPLMPYYYSVGQFLSISHVH